MKWAEVCIQTTRDAMEPISHILHESGVSGIEIEDPLDLVKERESKFGEVYELSMDHHPNNILIKVFFPFDERLNKKIDELKQSINKLAIYDIDLGNNLIKINEIDEIDWETSWKKYFKPSKISSRMIVVPTWEEYKTGNDELIINLDPGMAFGTGTHPTTSLCVQSLEKYVEKNDLIIDVGCGSGILSIASGLLGARKVYAFDLDKVAVNSTIDNVELNQLSNVVTTKQGSLLNDVHTKADIIISNILAEIIVRFTKDAWKNLKKNGLFITSGIIQRKKQIVINDLESAGFEIIEINEVKDWICIVAKKQ